jgi:4-hydroxybenzoate polyprenyltransferase
MAAMFVIACAALNPVCLALSPFALAVGAFYSYTKRFTWLCHFCLGSVIGLAPIAGWLAVSPAWSPTPLLLGLAVMFWIAGFDIIYSGQDAAFDKAEGLFSMPAVLGIDVSFALAAFCHANMVLFLLLTGLVCKLSWGWYLFLAITAWILYGEHKVAKTATPERLRKAFAMNGPISVLLLVGTLMGIYW